MDFFYYFRWQQRTVRFKLLLIGELVIISGIVALWLPMRNELRQQTVVQMQKQLQAIAATAALTTDGDLHEQMTSEVMWQESAFAHLQHCLRGIGAANPDLHFEHIYTFRADGDSVRFAVFTHPHDTDHRPRIGEGISDPARHGDRLALVEDEWKPENSLQFFVRRPEPARRPDPPLCRAIRRPGGKRCRAPVG
ncbi:MAG: hypothetical protein ABIF77_19435 [bacterium]